MAPMPASSFELAPGIAFGNAEKLCVIAGPCVIESADLCLSVAGTMRDLCADLGLPYVFKASFDKANRSSGRSYRGEGLEKGLAVLSAVRQQLSVPVLTDVHEPGQAEAVAAAVDVLQVPAFLSRQTDLLLACGEGARSHGRTVNVKKGQFMAPWDVQNVWDKLDEAGSPNSFITERGASFGYNNLVVDYRSLLWMKDNDIPCCFDATHSVQLPGGAGTSSGGQRQYIPGLATAAVSLGIAALFMEVHPDPAHALSDRETQLPLSEARPLLERLAQLDHWAKSDLAAG
jgi:2-dehydro-3-deoxyphosphooctonate aldolase (KDO 8-P synthase)